MSIDPVSSGGTGERTLQMSKALAKSGSACSILTLDIGNLEPVKQDLMANGVNVETLACWSRRFYIPSLNLVKIFRVIKRADIIHLMGHWTVLNAIVYWVARLLGKPYVVCPAGALPLFGRSQTFKKVYNWVIGRRIIRNASAFIAITDDEKDQFLPYGVNPDHIQIVNNGINPQDFSSQDVAGIRARHGLEKKPFILFVGRLNLIKGPDLLLEAYKQLGDRIGHYDLVFVGPDGGMREELVEASKRMGHPANIFFIGYLGGKDKSDIYHAAEFLVIPSRQEAMSIVVLEAGICKTAVLLTRACGFDEVAEVGGGVVVDAEVESLKAGLLEMSQRDDLKQMGEQLHRFVTENYTWADVGKKLERVLRVNVN
ncbi:glycosyltransferase family 4 protein [Pseudomonas kitaguniensis]|uniref:glycosyltransferase family 4 protein n=1 Tax=Pseudomonas kitaguniensis TaxID=2607908 RepID=UPI003D00D359